MHTSVITQHGFPMIVLWPCLMLCRHNPKTDLVFGPCNFCCRRSRESSQSLSPVAPWAVDCRSACAYNGPLFPRLTEQLPRVLMSWFCIHTAYTYTHAHNIYIYINIYIYLPYNGTICITLKVYRIPSNFRGLSSAWSFSLCGDFSGAQLAEPHNHCQDKSEPELCPPKQRVSSDINYIKLS